MAKGFYGFDSKNVPPLQKAGDGIYRATRFLKGASLLHVVPIDLAVKVSGPMREWQYCEAGFVIYGDKYLIRVAKTGDALSAVIHATGAKVHIEAEALVQPCVIHVFAMLWHRLRKGGKYWRLLAKNSSVMKSDHHAAITNEGQ